MMLGQTSFFKTSKDENGNLIAHRTIGTAELFQHAMQHQIKGGYIMDNLQEIMAIN